MLPESIWFIFTPFFKMVQLSMGGRGGESYWWWVDMEGSSSRTEAVKAYNSNFKDILDGLV